MRDPRTPPNVSRPPGAPTGEISDVLGSADRDLADASLSSTPTSSQRGGLWRDWMRPFLMILVCMTTFRSAVADWNHVPTGSMLPTILIGDRIFVNKLAYELRVPFTRLRLAHWATPQRGDIIVFLSPLDSRRLVKRVIGTPGDIIELRGHQLILNGINVEQGPVDGAQQLELAGSLNRATELHHSFVNEFLTPERTHLIMMRHSRNELFGPVEIPAAHYLVLGDNRDDSADSRVFGLVPADRILGEATAVAMSVDPDRFYLPRWDRFFQHLQ